MKSRLDDLASCPGVRSLRGARDIIDEMSAKGWDIVPKAIPPDDEATQQARDAAEKTRRLQEFFS